MHYWIGQLKIVDSAGFDNYLLVREDQDGKTEQLLAHVPFLVSCRYSPALPRHIAEDIRLSWSMEARSNAGRM